jgi:hypothetical protein
VTAQAIDATMRRRPAEEVEPLFRREEELMAARDDVDRATNAAGTQLGRGLQYFRVLAREDFSLAGMLNQARVAKGGKELTPGEKETVTKAQKEIEDAGDEATPESRIRTRKARRKWVETLEGIKDSERPPLIRAAKRVGEGLGLLRALKTSLDFSAVLRQGGWLSATNPTKIIPALGDMLRATISRGAYERQQQAILDRANGPLYDRAGLYLADSDGPLSRREEAFLTRWGKNIPGLAASERAYNGYLNRIRADVFDTMVAALAKNGRPTLAEARAVAEYINKATGRGGLGPLESAAVPLAHVFFAPRYLTSRLQLLAGQPLWGGSVRTRVLIAKEYVRAAVGLALVSALAAAAGAGLEPDPRSSDFAKFRFGRTRIDMAAGLAQPTTFLARNLTNRTKATTGGAYPLSGPGHPQGGLDYAKVWEGFVRSKLSPAAGVGADVLTREDIRGQPITAPVDLPGGGKIGRGSAAAVARELGQLVVPLAPKDVYEAVQEEGLQKGAGTAVLGLLGAGTQVHEQRKK